MTVDIHITLSNRECAILKELLLGSRIFDADIAEHLKLKVPIVKHTLENLSEKLPTISVSSLRFD